ncbi:MAG: hypothetical protein A2277_09265 [Desulfobacterales bacterium RIFOXYA12_FULL_46_15]|nr:MAG: hypothetical protein A2277_09265 [Desulfobacterales bacterium RIFOXYA12_FULL_46_15]
MVYQKKYLSQSFLQKISDSSTIQPFIEILIQEFTKNTGIALHISGGGSGAGIRNAKSGESDVGMVSRALKDDEKAAL